MITPYKKKFSEENESNNDKEKVDNLISKIIDSASAEYDDTLYGIHMDIKYQMEDLIEEKGLTLKDFENYVSNPKNKKTAAASLVIFNMLANIVSDY